LRGHKAVKPVTAARAMSQLQIELSATTLGFIATPQKPIFQCVQQRTVADGNGAG
jgi:hypothetical protein